MALALAAWAIPVTAQDALPSVSDYRLPSASPSPAARVRTQGPVDPDNPVAPAAPVTRRAEPSAAPPPAAAPSAAPRARPAAAASPTAAASPRPASPAPAASRPAPTGRPTTAAAAVPASAPTNSSAPVAQAASSPAPAASASAAPFEWRVHSAKEAAASTGSSTWLWLAGLAFVLGAAVMLIAQQIWRKRKTRADEAIDWEAPAAEPLAPDRPSVSLQPAEPIAELDLVNVLAEPAAPAPQPVPAIAPASGPIDMVLAARRLSATLMNTVLHYELTVSNNGKESIGPVMVGGDMIAAHASLPDRAQLELGTKDIAALHKLASLGAGESTTFAGEFKLPLAAITPIRSGNAALFIPLARFRVEASRVGTAPLVLARTFVVGEDQELPGAALKPFRLDLGPRLYSNIGQRELALSA